MSLVCLANRFVTATLVAIALSVAISAQQPENKTPTTASLTVLINNKELPPLVLVEVYFDGKVIGTRELKQGEISWHTWEKLAPGKYEVHYSATGFDKFVKRFVLVAGEETRTHAELSKKAVAIGGGPSIQELADELAKLKKDNAEMKAKLDGLQAEVDRLKKK